MNNTERHDLTAVTAEAAPQAAAGWGKILCGDCLAVTAGLGEGCLDLIYADPPFFTNRDFAETRTAKLEPGRTAGGGFSDRWSHGRGDYLRWLEERVRAMRRLLKPSGVFLLHLDWHAVHYAKVMCDGIFENATLETPNAKGRMENEEPENGALGGGFQNELIWYYQTGGASKGRFSRKHDTILMYSKGADFYFDGKAVAIPRTAGAMKRAKSGKGARIAVTDTHKNPDDVLVVGALNPMAKERTGWPTQKPVELLELLIKALVPVGGSVGDFFCGSGTTLVAAEGLGRKWVGADVSAEAVVVARGRVGAVAARS